VFQAPQSITLHGMSDRWVTIQPEPSIALAQATSPAPAIISLSTMSMPFSGMPGVVEYWATPYPHPYSVSSSITIAGEFAVVRLQGPLRKAYNYAFGIAPSGSSVFSGPFKNFDAHYTSSATSADVRLFFGHHPWIAIGRSGLTSA
jgi:hypothetical protein